MVMDLDEYGVDVAVEAPPADQVTDLSSALGDLGDAVDNYGSDRARRLTSPVWNR